MIIAEGFLGTQNLSLGREKSIFQIYMTMIFSQMVLTLIGNGVKKSSVTKQLVSSSEPSINPNAILEIYKAFQDRLTFLNRHMII